MTMSGVLQLVDERLSQFLFLMTQFLRCVFERVVAVIAVERDAENLAFARRAGEALLSVYPHFERGELEPGSRSRDKTIEIRAPGGAEEAGLREMAEKVIADMGPGGADFFLKIFP